jgi:hypothetical protein
MFNHFFFSPVTCVTLISAELSLGFWICFEEAALTVIALVSVTFLSNDCSIIFYFIKLVVEAVSLRLAITLSSRSMFSCLS